eukprot:TRINITY_DN1409_c0_g1_i1.p1 TRINITY_DN1409_c0_g1~~TRINITY_DN1409_c0_g1_i1.p1  ORF type:complete len:379 (-),score=58.79 TRINITY_DN1409_c0_g1_i1:1011-2147(-)
MLKVFPAPHIDRASMSGEGGIGSHHEFTPSQFPPHLVAEAMNAMRDTAQDATPMDVRWSAPISSDEMQYVEDYVKSRYPQIYMERVVGMNLPRVSEEEDVDPQTGSPRGGSPSVRDALEKQRQISDQTRRTSMRGNGPPQKGASGGQHWLGRWAPSGTSLAEEPGLAQLNPSRLAEIMSDKTASMDASMSVTEIHARNRVLQRCGVDHAEYHIVFTATSQEALMLVAEAYPFHRHNVYMTALDDGADSIREFASFKEGKVIVAPIVWLDLRIAGSQLSTNFRRKSKSNPKGLFAYPVQAGGLKNSLHWVSEAQRNLWHVLLDASELVLDADSFDLGQHKPDYLVCVSPKIVGYPKRVTCLLIRRASQSPGPVKPGGRS